MKITSREKWMFHSLVFVLLLIWLSVINTSHEEHSEALKDATQKLGMQEIWLNNEAKILSKLELSLKGFEKQKSIDSATLTGMVDAKIRNFRFKHELSTQKSVEDNVYKKHSLNLRISDCKLADVMHFESELVQDYPSIVLESIAMQPNRSNPTLLTVAMKICAYELK